METKFEKITVKATVNAPIEKVWSYWNDANHVMNWNSPSDDWHAPKASNDVREGGSFSYTMAAKDGSMSFDFAGDYTEVEENHLISYAMADGRKVKNVFDAKGDSVDVTVTFDAENQNPIEMQRGGWQAILDNFKKYVEKG
ncbi:MAG: polyketide cyclase [Flavobacterium sp.]|uniref:SRPBCC family protein n=1 Tax=Flavobacterium sp. TaxID=239 RepID=UPI001211A8E8|nr:SRPBCC family protein [Flavobacterium sp.]RZJ67799.1 MAG: polyketide cyclase [Flavobacterium sp.]